MNMLERKELKSRSPGVMDFFSEGRTYVINNAVRGDGKKILLNVPNFQNIFVFSCFRS